ncbi:MAG: hypothetical protein Q7U47_04230 [Paludibacter sp.]|nr:hypothetical protein [Paludibacter sp.]
MHKISKDPIASHILNANVVDWHFNMKSSSFEHIIRDEEQIIANYQPHILSVFLSSPTPEHINLFIKAGFEFIQCRLAIEKTISSQHFNLYPFELVEITEQKQFNDLLLLCKRIVFDDRYSIDLLIKPAKALERNMYFLKEAFEKKDQFVFLLINRTQNAICGFRSFKVVKNHTASMLLTGITKKDNLFDYAQIISFLELKALNDLNISKVNSVVSVNNFEEINRYIGELGYKVTNSNTVLRKIYNFRNI